VHHSNIYVPKFKYQHILLLR